MQINIDVTDWHEEVTTSPLAITSIDDAIDVMQETPVKPLSAARHLIVNRELQKAAHDVLPTNKLLLMTGGAVELRHRIDRRRRDVVVNEKSYAVREFVATVTTSPNGESGERVYESSIGGDTSDATLVRSDDPAAVERAEHYLFTNVTGRIRERLLIIAAGHGDVRQVAERLKAEIDLMVTEFSTLPAFQ